MIEITNKIIAGLLVLGIVLFGGGIYWEWSRAMPPTDNPPERLTMGEWVYFTTANAKIPIGSYLGTYVVSTGGCNRMAKSGGNAWTCTAHTTQNGWGVLYKMIPQPTEDGTLVNEVHAVIPLANADGYNYYEKAKINGSAFGTGQQWADEGQTANPGKLSVELVLYNPSDVGEGIIFPGVF